MTLEAETLGESGFSAASLEVTSEGNDTLTLTADLAIDEPPVISAFEKVILTAGGVRRFVGWLDQAPRRAAGSASSLSYTLAGPMRWLERVTLASEGTGGLIQLGVDVEGLGADVTALDVNLRFVLDHAIARVGAVIDYVDADLEEDIFQHPIAPEFRIDSTCDVLIRRLLKFAPTVSYWWDYTTTVPTIRFADTARASADKTLSESAYELSAAGLNPRYDLLHDQVQIYWTSRGVLINTEVTASGGDGGSLGAGRTLIRTFDLAGLNMPPEGLAAAFARYYTRLHIDAEAEMVGLDWSHRPGHLWGFAGLLANGYRAFCTGVTRDLFNLTQSIKLGVPPAFDTSSLTGGNDSSPESDPPTVEITRTIEDPDGNPIDGDAFFVINGVAAPSGQSIELPAGSYVIIYLVPEKYIAPFQESTEEGDPPTYEQIVIEQTSPTNAILTTGSADATVTATLRERLRLRAADNTDTEIDLRVADIPDWAGIDDPAKMPQIKLREIERCDGKRAMVLMSEWYDPPA